VRLTPGTVVGAYEIIAPLGAGGMGEVYRARDPRLDREVAIKILPGASGEASTPRTRFIREARAASALVHPNIITIHEIDSAGDVDFIVMEYVRGESLADLLSRGRLPLNRALDYGAQIADALAAAHAAEIVHRDLKPSNVMITSSGFVKVLDFGIAKRLKDTDAEQTTVAALTLAGAAIGTPAYMSPEQTLGDPIDGRSDVFSFGVVLYEMLSGRLPFQATTERSLARQIVQEPPQPLKRLAPDLPDDVIAMVERCLVKEPEGRYESAGRLRDDLRRLAIGSTPSAIWRASTDPQAATVPSATPPRPRRWPTRAQTIAAAVLLLVIGGWLGGPALVRWLRLAITPQAQLTDEDAPPEELVARATERLRRHYRDGNVDLAIRQLNRALQLRPQYAIADARLSLAYGRKNNASADPEWQKRVLAHAERAVAGNEQLAMAHVALGAARMLAGQLDRAAAEYHAAETLEPSNWELLARLGDLASARRDMPSAERLYRRTIEVAPGEWEAQARLGAFLYQQARYTEALASFERVRELAPDHPRAYSNLAAAYHQLDRTDEAAAVLQRALEIAPDALTYSNLGTLLYFQGKYREAEQAFDAAVKLNANAYQRWGNLGDAVRMVDPGSQKMHESYRRAIQLAREDLAKKPDPNIRSSLALYLVRDGQTAGALAELDGMLAEKALSGAVLFKATLVAELAAQRPRALALLGGALEAGYKFREIRTEPDLVRLRADPEYHKLASKYEK